MKEKEAKIQAKVIGMPLRDFFCNVSYVLIEFLSDCEVGLSIEHPVRIKRGDRCVLGFGDDCYVGDGNIISLRNITVEVYKGTDCNKPSFINCKEIFNETWNLGAISSMKAKREKSKRDSINFKGVIMGEPSYSNDSRNVFFPLKIETSITATFKNEEHVLKLGDVLLIQSHYYCYVRKGDTIQIRQGRIFKYTSKKMGKSYLLLKTKDFFDETLGISMMRLWESQ